MEDGGILIEPRKCDSSGTLSFGEVVAKRTNKDLRPLLMPLHRNGGHDTMIWTVLLSCDFNQEDITLKRLPVLPSTRLLRRISLDLTGTLLSRRL